MDLSDFMNTFLGFLGTGFTGQAISTSKLVATELVLLALSAYTFFLYRFTTKKAFYSKPYNITIAVMPFFIATIIMTLQSSLLITLGTVGALAIIRYRTAIKDPMDMLYLFWAVHNGIVCGSGFYKIAIVTSAVVSVVMLVLDMVPLRKAPYLLVLNSCHKDVVEELTKILEKDTSYYKIKSRNFTKRGLDMIVEVRVKDDTALVEQLLKLETVGGFSLMSYDGETVV